MTGLVGNLVDGVRRLFGSRHAAPAPMAFGYADLRGGGSRIAIIPQLGGRISALELGGREWLSGTSGTAEESTFGSLSSGVEGGFLDCFPTSAACTIPTWVHKFGGVALPERGELWSQRPHFEVHTDGQPTAITTWTGERMPYELKRTVQVAGDGTVTFDYVASNKGRDPLPFLWSAIPLLTLSPRTRIVLPDGVLARVAVQHGIDLGAGAREQRWPRFRVRDKLVDMSRPDSVAGRYACMLYVAMPREPVAVEEGDVRLEISTDAGQVPNLGIWINRGGWPTGTRGEAPHQLALQPCLGAPESLADALSDWKSVQWLAPDEAREWRLTFRARPLTSETRATRGIPDESRQRSQ